MVIHRNFEELYDRSEDPYETREATLPYYDEVIDFIKLHQDKATTLLDIGCGSGAFTNRLRAICPRPVGIDLAKKAVAYARTRYPQIEFHAVDVRHLANKRWSQCAFDMIICSQVLYYLPLADIHSVCYELARLLDPRGTSFFFANCEGNGYFTPQEFTALIHSTFRIVQSRRYFDHLFIACRRRDSEIIITLDHEAPENDAIKLSKESWARSVIEPTCKVMEAAERHGAIVTLMTDMGQLSFLEEFLPDLANAHKELLVEAIKRGHDVQPQLHPSWLPQNGASFDVESRKVTEALHRGRAHDWPGDLTELFRHLKFTLELLLRPHRAKYSAVVFRAGKYRIQPHTAVFTALRQAGFLADSSAWQDRYLPQCHDSPGVDCPTFWTSFQPYIPSPKDLCIPHRRPEPSDVMEFPIFSVSGRQWSFDAMTAEQLISLFSAYEFRGGIRVMIGHRRNLTAENLTAFEIALATLKLRPHVTFCSFQTAVERWRQENQGLEGAGALDYQTYEERSALSVSGMYDRLGNYHRYKVDLLVDRGRREYQARGRSSFRVLDVGCGTGELSTFAMVDRMKDLEGLAVRAIDIDAPSIQRAILHLKRSADLPIKFVCVPLEHVEGKYDLIVCSEVLEHLLDPLPFLTEVCARIADDGLLVLTVPNGFGHDEIERRIRGRILRVVLKRPWLTRLGRKMRTAGRRILRHQSVVEAVSLIETLNFGNNLHVQAFTLDRLRKALNKAGMNVVDVRNTRVIGGLLGVILDRLRPFGVDSTTGASWIHPALSSGWLLECRPLQQISSVRTPKT